MISLMILIVLVRLIVELIFIIINGLKQYNFKKNVEMDLNLAKLSSLIELSKYDSKCNNKVVYIDSRGVSKYKKDELSLEINKLIVFFEKIFSNYSNKEKYIEIYKNYLEILDSYTSKKRIKGVI
ncbi:MAG: hypothetical protein N2749_05945 [Clostridia bacterium]|nr:hypothetical protein [Clostridia bacterium]